MTQGPPLVDVFWRSLIGRNKTVNRSCRFSRVDSGSSAHHAFYQKAEVDAGSDRPGSDFPPPALRTLYRGALHPGVLFAALLFEVAYVLLRFAFWIACQ